MEDSFFGFDTSVPLDDDGGGRIAEPSEEEYDALNDETFGSAINGDWEEVHENLVRMTGESDNDGDAPDSGSGGHEASGGNSDVPANNALKNARLQRICDSDLELNLAGMKLDDVDISYSGGDSESMAGSYMGDMQPSVWSLHPSTKEQQRPNADQLQLSGNRMPPNATAFLRERFASPFHKQQQQQPHPQYRMIGPPPPHPHRQTPVNTHMPPGIPFGLSHLPRMPHTSGPPNICTLEDIERNIMMQQASSKQEQQKQNPAKQELKQQQMDAVAHQQHLLNEALKQTSKTPTPIQQQQTQQQQQLMMQQHLNQKMMQKVPSGGFPTTAQQSPPRATSNFANNLAQHPFGNLLQQQQQQQHHPQQQQQQQQQQQYPQAQHNSAGNRLNPSFFFPQAGPHPQLPPHPLLNQHGMSNNFPNQRPLPNPHLPVALNNFAMHPNFNAMRAAACAAGIHPAALLAQQQQSVAAAAAVSRIPGHPPNPMMLLNNQSSSNASINMFNMRLLQEIQQNHPLLQNPARLAQQLHPNMAGQNNVNVQHLHLRGNVNTPGANPKQQNHSGRRDGTGNGNLPHEEYDEYANLMSTRDKHWLIGIQLSQLNTDTPYIDDYYYTVYKERKVAQNGSLRHSQAHKDNQLNHPLTQPKGHAQLILVQLGNKNGTRNGQQRERHNSDNHNNNQDMKLPMYVFTPLRFENSLGKLQYCSVTAPRKIIDAEIMNNEASNTCNNGVGDNNTANASGVSAGATASNNVATAVGEGDNKSETPVLAQPPSNTATGPGENQRKSRYILLHIETLYRLLLKLDDLNNPNAIATILMKKKKESERIVAMEQMENANKTPEERAIDSASNLSLKCKFNYEIETREALIEKVIAGLQHDKVVAMMNVRKGKVLIRRLMPYIEEHDMRWNVWIGVFSSLQTVFKKDRDDTEGVLYSLYPEFKKHIKSANFETVVKISSAITLNEKKSNGVFCSKFGISSLVFLIQQAETIYDKSEDPTLSDQHKDSWRQFLDQVATALNRTIQNQTICAAIESDSIQPIMNHFARFKDLKLDSLLALITEAKQQIN